MKPLLRFGLLAMLLATCGCTTTRVVDLCPPFPWPSSQALDALEPLAERNPDVGSWVIQLDQHGKRCDTINAANH